jgi:glycosyltransferase involved in cell wall biosynthesis
MMSLAFLPIYPLLFRMFMREAESVIVYNTIQKQILQPFHPNVIVAPSGVDTDLFSPRPSSREGPFTIGLAGRYYEEGKGLELALAACRLLRSQGVEFTLLVASPRLEGYRDDFLHYCGWYDREKLPEFYSRCDVIVVPSMWEEPFGITAVEALSCGIPVIASSSGALPTIVDDGVTGFLFPRGDAGALADRMMRLAKDPGLARRMGAAAREKALKAYRWDAIMEKIYLPLFGGDGRYG